MHILGVEGTAWAASAASYDTDTDTIDITTEQYTPDSGGLHPREAAEHMREHIPRVIETTLSQTTDPIDAVAFSQGPGLGPCLRIVATAARAAAMRLDVPLIGVNHMVAHLEVGRHTAEFNQPVCLNASGANAHILTLHNGRYRVLGETMDTGVGNALDKFARYVDWDHPGGPKIESHAAAGDYVELPYVVKGMDFSFAGITSAAQTAVEDGTPIPDVCCGIQETIFGMLTEVAERALALTDSTELVLGGGVGQNHRLQSMLTTMCADRDASFHAPDPRFLRDNAGMIAILGAKMLAADDTIAIEHSRVRPDYRPDEVPVTWRDPPPSETRGTTSQFRGAEATIEFSDDTVTKHRLAKPYRHPTLDTRIRRTRTVAEARLTSLARRNGVPSPVVLDIDRQTHTLTLQAVGDADLKTAVTKPRLRKTASHLATLHNAGIVHGDPTVRNIRIDTDTTDQVYFIDFGLGYHSHDIEDHAMDLHILNQSLAGTATDADSMIDTARTAYAATGNEAVLDRLTAITDRGRYR